MSIREEIEQAITAASTNGTISVDDAIRLVRDVIVDPLPPHPNQPVVLVDGEVRFHANKIVQHIYAQGPFTAMDLADLPVTNDDRNQFAQLIGYSVSGFSELSYAQDSRVAWADNEADDITYTGDEPDADEEL